MCGILGVVSSDEVVAREGCERMLDQLQNRGPDSSGLRELDHGRVILGHRRLAILDLSASGHQPMTNETGDVWLTFNGEIYNYQELRETLRERGHVFSSATDSEAIIHAYEEWGRDCVAKLSGIFAFGIWDERQKVLLLGRDHLGVKPLYYFMQAGRFAFASQSSALIAAPGFVRKIDPGAFAEFLGFSYVPSDTSVWDSIQQLPPGTSLLLKDGKVTTERFWEPNPTTGITDFGEAMASVDEALTMAVARQMQSDVPIGTLLSGGIDSTLLTGMAAETGSFAGDVLSSFTIGFDEATSDEREFASIASSHYHTRHVFRELDAGSFPHSLFHTIEAFDEPMDLNSPMPATALATLVQDTGLKVVLGGDGGDELFSGYLRYDEIHQFAQSFQGPSQQIAGQYFMYEGVATPEAIGKVLHPGLPQEVTMLALRRQQENFREDLHPVTAAQLSDLLLYLPGHILTKVDRAMMYRGVEARVPLLDIALVEAALKIGPEIHYRDGERKALLKSAAERFLPAELRTSRKKGFSSPLGKWFKAYKFWSWGKKLVKDGVLVGEKILHPQVMDALDDESMEKRVRMGWMIMGAELWARRWLEPSAKVDLLESLRPVVRSNEK